MLRGNNTCYKLNREILTIRIKDAKMEDECTIDLMPWSVNTIP